MWHMIVFRKVNQPQATLYFCVRSRCKTCDFFINMLPNLKYLCIRIYYCYIVVDIIIITIIIIVVVIIIIIIIFTWLSCDASVLSVWYCSACIATLEYILTGTIFFKFFSYILSLPFSIIIVMLMQVELERMCMNM